MGKSGRPPSLPTIFQKYDPPLYFVTICCANRKRLLANDAIHSAFREFAARGQRDQDIALGRYVLMPDHLHLFVCGPPEFKLAQWVRMLKIALGKALKESEHEP